MNFDFNNNKPIYKQLVDQLKIAIVTDVYEKGSKLPSVREFALNIKVNPNTINRALLELEECGLILTKRTSGKFVTEESLVINKIRKELAEETIEDFLENMKKLDISKKEILELIKGD